MSSCRRKKILVEVFDHWRLVIGDKDIDVLAAKNAKIRGFLFEGGNLSYKIKKILNIT